MNVPEELKYTKSHEWARVDGNVATPVVLTTCGITDYAQSELSDIVYVELKQVGFQVKKGEPFGTIEAVKAVSDLYAPVSGKIIETNKELADSPNLVNEDPYEKGWMVKIEMSNPDEINELLGPEDYERLITQNK